MPPVKEQDDIKRNQIDWSDDRQSKKLLESLKDLPDDEKLAEVLESFDVASFMLRDAEQSLLGANKRLRKLIPLEEDDAKLKKEMQSLREQKTAAERRHQETLEREHALRNELLGQRLGGAAGPKTPTRDSNKRAAIRTSVGSSLDKPDRQYVEWLEESQTSFKDQLKERDNAIAELSANIEFEKKNAAIQVEARRHLENEMDSCQQEIEKMMTELSKTRGEDGQEAAQKVTEVTKTGPNAEREHKEALATVEQQAKDIAGLQEEVGNLSADNEKLLKTLASTETETQGKRDNWNKLRKMLEQDISTRNDQVEAIKNTVSQQASYVVNLTNELGATKITKRQSAVEKAELKTTLEAAEEAVDSLQSAAKTARKKADKALDEKARVQKDLATVSKQLQEAQEKLEAVNAHIRHLESSGEATRSRSEDLRSNAASYQGPYQSILGSLATAEKKLQVQRAHSSTPVADVAEAKQEVNELKRNRRDMAETLATLRRDAETASAVYDEQIRQLGDLRARLGMPGEKITKLEERLKTRTAGSHDEMCFCSLLFCFIPNSRLVRFLLTRETPPCRQHPKTLENQANGAEEKNGEDGPGPASLHESHPNQAGEAAHAVSATQSQESDAASQSETQHEDAPKDGPSDESIAMPAKDVALVSVQGQGQTNPVDCEECNDTFDCPYHYPRDPYASIDRFAPSCGLGHGHGGKLYRNATHIVCQILTAIFWLIFLIATQPYGVWKFVVFATGYIRIPWHMLMLAIYYGRKEVTKFRNRKSRISEGAKASTEGEEGTEGTSEAGREGPPEGSAGIDHVVAIGLSPPDAPTMWPHPSAAAMAAGAISLGLGFAWLAMTAVMAERQVWVQDNGWRMEYLRDILGETPYPEWSPVEVDFRLLTAAGWLGGGVNRILFPERYSKLW